MKVNVTYKMIFSVTIYILSGIHYSRECFVWIKQNVSDTLRKEHPGLSPIPPNYIENKVITINNIIGGLYKHLVYR